MARCHVAKSLAQMCNLLVIRPVRASQLPFVRCLIKRVFLLNPGMCCATGSEKFENLCGIINIRTVLNQPQSRWPGRFASVS